MPPNKLQIFLSAYYVYLLELNFFLLIVAFILSYKYIKEIFLEIHRKPLLLLIIISIFGIFFTSVVNPRNHRIYYDEDINCSIGQCIAHHKRAVMCNEGYYENNELKVVEEEYNKQPAAYPYLISIIFSIFGTNELYAFIFNNLLFGLMVFVIFFIVYLLFNDVFAGLAASLVYILIPVNVQWFNTGAVEPSTVFFASMAVLASLIYIRNKKPVSLFLLTSILAFSFNFRPESFLIVLVIGLIFLLKDIGILTRKELYMFGALLLVLSTGIIIHLYAMRNESWGASGPKFSLKYLPFNFSTNSTFYFDNEAFPLLFTVFGITGLLFYKYRDYIKEKTILMSWLLVFWGIFLFFYAGTYKHDFGLSARFSILSYIPISIFVGLGFSFVRSLLEKRVKPIELILVALIIFNAHTFLPFIRMQSRGESAACRMDHFYAMKFIKLLPENSIIFTHNPNMFLVHKRSALQTSTETYNPGTVERLRERFKGGVFVHYNYWSGVDYNELQRSFTKFILDKYEYEILEEHYFNNYKYGLYKLTNRRE